MDLSPIHHDVAHLTLERPEDTSNKFVIRRPWLLAVVTTDFPEEHWNDMGIPAAFEDLGQVVEIDPDCLRGDHSNLHVIVTRETPDLPLELQWLGDPSDEEETLGVVFHLEVIKIWPRREQLDDFWRLCPFFPRAPGDEF